MASKKNQDVVEMEVDQNIVDAPEEQEELIEVAASPIDKLPLMDRMVVELIRTRKSRDNRFFVFILNEDDRIVRRIRVKMEDGATFPTKREIAVAAQKSKSGRFAVLWNHPQNVTKAPEADVNTDIMMVRHIQTICEILDLTLVEAVILSRGGQISIVND